MDAIDEETCQTLSTLVTNVVDTNTSDPIFELLGMSLTIMAIYIFDGGRFLMKTQWMESTIALTRQR
jgi:hypothetical protein